MILEAVDLVLVKGELILLLVLILRICLVLL